MLLSLRFNKEKSRNKVEEKGLNGRGGGLPMRSSHGANSDKRAAEPKTKKPSRCYQSSPNSKTMKMETHAHSHAHTDTHRHKQAHTNTQTQTHTHTHTHTRAQNTS